MVSLSNLCATLIHHHGDTRASPLLRVPSSPCSKAPWILHLVQNKGRNGAWEALKAMVGDMFGPLVRNISDIRFLCSVYYLQDYQVGMLFGSFLGCICIGCYQL